MHFLSTRAGLGNRMRSVVSYLAVARFLGCHLTVYWSGMEGWNNSAVLFGDLFELPAAPDLHIIAPQDTRTRKRMPDDTPTTYHIHPQTRPIFPLLGPLALRIFRPLPPILARIEALLGKLGPAFTALHIRRTDKNSDYAQDAALAAWTRRHPDSKVFVAADNAISLANVRGALPEGMVVAQDSFGIIEDKVAKRKQKRGRHTTLADAVVDMWTASFAAHFRGTITSSYSVLVQQLRTGRDPTGEIGVDAWVSNCADTADYPRVRPPPFWSAPREEGGAGAAAAQWPTDLTFTNVTAAWKVAGDEMCDKYRKVTKQIKH